MSVTDNIVQRGLGNRKFSTSWGRSPSSVSQKGRTTKERNMKPTVKELLTCIQQTEGKEWTNHC